jgi:Mg/Co/Ni transporter MgtE
MELLAQEMSAFGYDEAAVVRSVGQQIYQTLQTAKAWTVWILILMGPGGVGLQILTAVRRWLVVNDLQVRRVYTRADTNLGKDTLIASKLTIRSSVP